MQKWKNALVIGLKGLTHNRIVMNDLDFLAYEIYGVLLLVMFGASWWLFCLGRKYALKIKDDGDFSFACILAVLIAGSFNFTNSLFDVCLFISRFLSKDERTLITNLMRKK